jgi:hypothetical protein
MSLAELQLRECYFRLAEMADLSSPRGGTVRDHVPVHYEGFDHVRRGIYVEELHWNALDPLAPRAAKGQRLATRYIEAAGMLIEPRGHTMENWVRLHVAEAQYYVLTTKRKKMEEYLNSSCARHHPSTSERNVAANVSGEYFARTLIIRAIIVSRTKRLDVSIKRGNKRQQVRE